MKRWCRAWLFLVTTVVAAPGLAQSTSGEPSDGRSTRVDTVRIHVAPGGATSGTDIGTPAKPAGSLTAAQTLVRAAIAKMGRQRKPVEVVISAGEYVLDAPLALTREDSGAPGAPVVWRAEQPGSVVISGGTRLETGASSGGVVLLRAKGLDPKQWAGAGQLYVNSQRATLARQPNQNDYWFLQAAIAEPGESDKDRGANAFKPWGDAQAWIASMSAADKSRAVVHVMQSWTSGMHRINGPQPEGGVRVKPKSIWPYMSNGLNQRFWVENVTKAFDAPGEWIGEDAEVRYRPRAGESGKPIDAVLARLDKLLTITGDANQPVEEVEFRGLQFQHARFAVPADGYQDNQAAQAMGAAIEVDGAKGIVFDQCVVAHTGAYGLWLRRNVRESRVTRCEFRDLGAGGIRVGLQKQSDDPMATGSNVVRENVIVGTGRVMPGGVGIWVGQSFDNEVAHNAISDTTYTGISVGWSWGYAPASSGRNRILSNLLFDIGRGMLADGAAIYTLGVSPGTEIIGNVIREVRGYQGYGYGAFGLYNDQGSSGITMRNNIVVGTDTGGYYLHFGRDLVLKDNLFALGRMAEIRVGKPDQQTNLEIAGNVLIPLGREPLEGKFPPGAVALRANAVSERQADGKLDTKACGAGCTLTGANVALGDTAKDLRFSGLDLATAGWVERVLADVGPPGETVRTRGKPELTLEARAPKPRAPAVPLELSLGDTELGKQPPGLRFVPANNTEAIKVVADSAAPGGRCLEFRDSASFSARSEPNAYALLNHEQGTSIARFAVRTDANATFVHEWRDDGRPFRTGPSITFDGEGVKAGGRLIAKTRPGEWVEVALSAPLESNDGRWAVEIKSHGSVIGRAADLKFGTSGWQHLNWIGFISYAAGDSTACLADVAIANHDGRSRPTTTK